MVGYNYFSGVLIKYQVKVRGFNLMKLCVNTVVILYSFFIHAQSTDVIPPTVTHLKNYPPPSTKYLQEGIAQGKGFYKTFDTEDGLASNTINSGANSVLCDSNGNLWFATNGKGVSRYDGKTFANYGTLEGLASNIIHSICEDKLGNLWFGTNGFGVSKYDGKSFTTYTTKDGLANNNVMSIISDSCGILWFGTFGGGVSKFDGTSFSTITTNDGLASNKVMSLGEDKRGNIWMGTYGGGVNRYDGKSLYIYDKRQGLTNNIVYEIIEDSHGNIWIATEGGGNKIKWNFGSNQICLLNTCNHNLQNVIGIDEHNKNISEYITTYTTDHGLPVKSVYNIVEDKFGNIWFSTWGGGVSKFDGENFITYGKEHGLISNYIRSITLDNVGNLWFGTSGGGVSRYNGKSFLTYSTEHGLANNKVFCTTEDKKGNIWFGTFGGGVSMYNGESFVTYSMKQGLSNDYILSITEDRKGNVWLGTWGGGVSMFDGSSFTTYTTQQGLGNNIVTCITQDKSGDIWFATMGGGVSKFNGESFKTFTKEDGLANNQVRSIIQDRNANLWMGTMEGVSMFDGEKFTNYKKQKGLFNDDISGVIEDKKGNFWIGTRGGGVSILKPNTKQGNVFSNIDVSKGLPDNQITGIVEDKKGNIIIGTNNGLGVIPLGDLNMGIEIYNQFNGYPVQDVNGGTNSGSIYCDSNSVVWIGTGTEKTALVRFEYNEILKNLNQPKIVVEKVKIKEVEICWYSLNNKQLSDDEHKILEQQEILTYNKALTNTERELLKKQFLGIEFNKVSKFYPIPQKLNLPYKFNTISFEYNAIETGRNFKVNYQYMLGGQDENWSAITKKTDVSFNNLYEGEYIFLLKAQSPWGVWSNPVKYSFVVLPPWYRTWWSMALYIALFIFGMWYIINIKTKTLKLRQKELKIKIKNATIEILGQKEELATKNMELSKKNEEKTDMLKEIHHRVKNNLQVVRSLLKLQSRSIEDQKVVAMFEEAQNRVLSMALLHEKMYRSDDLKHIDVQEHVTLLVEDLVKTYAVGKSIKLDIKIEEVDIGMRTLIPLGLIINEIITNALKYAFNGGNGNIIVHLNQVDVNNFELIIGDDGVGVSEKEQKESTGIGTKLIHSFTRQLNGTLQRLDKPGTVFKLIFERIGTN